VLATAAGASKPCLDLIGDLLLLLLVLLLLPLLVLL
jgi:hypothetical protein